MTDLYTLRGRAQRARLLELVTTAHDAGCADWVRGADVEAREYAASVVPPVPTRRRTREFNDGNNRYTLTYADRHHANVHRYRIAGAYVDGYLSLTELVQRFHWELAETIAECCIDLSTNPDEDIE